MHRTFGQSAPVFDCFRGEVCFWIGISLSNSCSICITMNNSNSLVQKLYSRIRKGKEGDYGYTEVSVWENNRLKPEFQCWKKDIWSLSDRKRHEKDENVICVSDVRAWWNWSQQVKSKNISKILWIIWSLSVWKSLST